jgi:SAM-dependent methyltransferase
VHLALRLPAARGVARGGARGGAFIATLIAALATPARAQDEGVPFITTPDQVTVAMLELARVGEADHVIDLGSGDGRIVITAARRFGATGLGVEIVPDLVAKSRQHARAAGVSAKVEFREQDLFATDLSRATVVTMYLLPEVNLQLRPRLLALAPGTRIVSHDWDLGDWQADRTIALDVADKAVGREKKSTLFLWIVPARVMGLWCAGRGDQALELALTQRFQRFSATLTRRGQSTPLVVFDGRITGSDLRTESALTTQAHLRAIGTDSAMRLEWRRPSGAAAAAVEPLGGSFTRAGEAGC